MSAFSGNLQLDFGDWTDTGNGRIAVLIGAMDWTCDEPDSVLSVTIPAGYMTDGATLPQWLWWFLPPWGDPATRAAILHDYLCGMLDKGTPIKGAETREACDRQFRLALLAVNVPAWRAWLCWSAVRAASLASGRG